MYAGDAGITMEADPKHRRLVLEQLCLDGDNASALFDNGVLQKVHDEGNDAEELLRTDATAYRALAARVNYLAQDSPELQSQRKKCRKTCRLRRLGVGGDSRNSRVFW